MDSRVAAMVADILFEIQRSENNVVEMKMFCPSLNSPDILNQLEKSKVNENDSEIDIKKNDSLKIDSNHVEKKDEVKLDQKESDQNNSEDVDENLSLEIENKINNDFKETSFSSIIYHINGTDNDNSTLVKV